MNRFEAAMKEAASPISKVLTVLDQEIERLEAELAEAKSARTRGRKLVAMLDPDSAKPKPKGKSHEISVNQLAMILGAIRANVNGQGTFWAEDVGRWAEVHQTTANKALKALHEQGQIRLDHMGGARKTTKFFALVGGDDGH